MSQEFPVSKETSGASASGETKYFMGGFALGAGTYSVDVLFADPQAHIGRKSLKLSVPEMKAGLDQPALPSGQVMELSSSPWDGKFSITGPRLTVLLNANSEIGSVGAFNIVHPSANGGDMLSAYDPDYLLTIIGTLLSRLSCSSANIVAYDVDRQVEVFREENVNLSTFDDLKRALVGREMQTIDVGALQNGSRENFLHGLVRKEAFATKRPDIVLLLGDPVFFGSRAPESFAGIDRARTRFIYLKSMNYSSRLPIPYRDGIQELTKQLQGTTLTFDSPETLASVIERLQRRVQ